ncbi:cohesin domain-containing protein [Bacillus sp. S/N-304-OC-R1]|uniref:cohesin domain-containing protein n=1 Tax=Bacillus sp. S/N-304-OC-R1 TaxID=2758034 RepID=UPI0021AFC07F|nr:cohesin domain-containing protein [Bacillus sp. S/N-304-OC-R1]
MIQKWAISLIVVILAIGIGLSPAHASENVGQLIAGTKTGKANETVNLPIILSSNGEVAAMQFQIKYDSSALDLREVKSGSGLNGFSVFSKVETGKVLIGNISGKTIPAGKNEIIYATFKIKESAPLKTYNITLQDVAISDSDAKDITNQFSISTGGITVQKEQSPTPPPVLNDNESEQSQPPANIEQIKVDVEGENGKNLTQTPITRTTEANGKVKDYVSMSEAIAKDTVEKAKQQGVDTARIVIPDTNDKVSEVMVEIPKSALRELNNGKMKLEIATDNAIISIPTESISSFNDNLYFRVVPLKSKEQQKQVEERAKKEEAVHKIAQNQIVQVLGRPMEIETNMQSREVSIVLPLKDSLPADANEREKVLNNLTVFIEHSDGTKEVLRGKVISLKNNGELGLSFNVNKFSTFAIVYMDGAQAFFDGKACGKDIANAIGCLNAKKSVPLYELVNNRLKKVDVLKAGQTIPAYEAISPMLGLGGDVWVERTGAIKYETPSKSMLVKNAATGSKRTKQIWKGLELRPGQIGKVTVLQDTVVWEKINKTQKLPRILKKGEQYRVYRYVPGMYDLGNGKYVVQDEFLNFKSF